MNWTVFFLVFAVVFGMLLFGILLVWVTEWLDNRIGEAATMWVVVVLMTTIMATAMGIVLS